MNDDGFENEIPQSQQQIDIAALQRATEMALPVAASGHVFTHRWLNEALDLPSAPATVPEYKRWEIRRDMLVVSWRKTLLSHGVHVENSRRRGYEVIAERETQRVAEGLATKVVQKALEDAADKIRLASAASLTSEEIAERHNALTRLGALYIMLGNQKKRPPRPGLRVIESASSASDEPNADAGTDVA